MSRKKESQPNKQNKHKTKSGLVRRLSVQLMLRACVRGRQAFLRRAAVRQRTQIGACTFAWLRVLVALQSTAFLSACYCFFSFSLLGGLTAARMRVFYGAVSLKSIASADSSESRSPPRSVGPNLERKRYGRRVLKRPSSQVQVQLLSTPLLLVGLHRPGRGCTFASLFVSLNVLEDFSYVG